MHWAFGLHLCCPQSDDAPSTGKRDPEMWSNTQVLTRWNLPKGITFYTKYIKTIQNTDIWRSNCSIHPMGEWFAGVSARKWNKAHHHRGRAVPVPVPGERFVHRAVSFSRSPKWPRNDHHEEINKSIQEHFIYIMIIYLYVLIHIKNWCKNVFKRCWLFCGCMIAMFVSNHMLHLQAANLWVNVLNCDPICFAQPFRNLNRCSTDSTRILIRKMFLHNMDRSISHAIDKIGK